MDGGAWWAAVSGVAQSRTRLKRLSSSSSYLFLFYFSAPKQYIYSFYFFTKQGDAIFVQTEVQMNRYYSMYPCWEAVFLILVYMLPWWLRE